MPAQVDVSRHYARGPLIEDIRAALAAVGKGPGSLTVDDLAPVDEFHTGGRKATEALLSQIGLSAQMHVLDVGCGLGGAARLAASRYACRVTGVDLTAEFVTAGNILSEWVGLDQVVALHQGSAVSMPFDDRSFDGAYMLHVGMNIEDKEKLAAEVARVLRPGSRFGIYEMMRTGPGDLVYPVPWASSADLSAVAEPMRYERALQAAGFAVTAERNRRDFALSFFAELRARSAAASGPPPLGIHILMGKSAREMVRNLIDNISEGRVAPVEMLARKL